ncbi:MAG: hydroxyquinol 1,2-dioxygenase [bacterium]|nr:hydroxyquinol 1,2-dioxygenase [bacterium]
MQDQLGGQYSTAFGSLGQYEKGGVEVINDNPKHYAFSNMFEVATGAKPYEKVAVAKNLEYVLEVIRAEGTSGWRATPHDEFALVMDGSLEVELLDPDEQLVSDDASGSIGLEGTPAGKPMGRVQAGRGHMTLLPAGKAYRLHSDGVAVVLLQTIEGPDTVYRWADICQTV